MTNKTGKYQAPAIINVSHIQRHIWYRTLSFSVIIATLVAISFPRDQSEFLKFLNNAMIHPVRSPPFITFAKPKPFIILYCTVCLCLCTTFVATKLHHWRYTPPCRPHVPEWCTSNTRVHRTVQILTNQNNSSGNQCHHCHVGLPYPSITRECTERMVHPPDNRCGDTITSLSASLTDDRDLCMDVAQHTEIERFHG